jgi:hypothetical protein
MASHATQRNATLVEESAAASESLRELARRMTESVAPFTLKDLEQPAERALAVCAAAVPHIYSTV